MPAEFLGGVLTEIDSPTSKASTAGTVRADQFSSRDELTQAINGLAEEKKLLAVERLSADAIAKYPGDNEFKIIHTRALLDLGRTAVTKPVLETLMTHPEYRDEARFLFAIALLSEL
jgi:hypothetical protein